MYYVIAYILIAIVICIIGIFLVKKKIIFKREHLSDSIFFTQIIAATWPVSIPFVTMIGISYLIAFLFSLFNYLTTKYVFKENIKFKDYF